MEYQKQKKKISRIQVLIETEKKIMFVMEVHISIFLFQYLSHMWFFFFKPGKIYCDYVLCRFALLMHTSAVSNLF